MLRPRCRSTCSPANEDWVVHDQDNPAESDECHDIHELHALRWCHGGIRLDGFLAGKLANMQLMTSVRERERERRCASATNNAQLHNIIFHQRSGGASSPFRFILFLVLRIFLFIRSTIAPCENFWPICDLT
jgi:hypothetical protein